MNLEALKTNFKEESDHLLKTAEKFNKKKYSKIIFHKQCEQTLSNYNALEYFMITSSNTR